MTAVYSGLGEVADRVTNRQVMARRVARFGDPAQLLVGFGVAPLSQLEQSTTSLLSDTQDADMAKTMIDFSMQQTVYQSALRAGANIVQASLLDFLS